MSTAGSDALIPIGFGVGLIAAAVASTANNIDSVIILGVEAVSIAFRLAVDLQRTGRAIEDSGGSWARVISNSNLAKLNQQLNEFNGKQLPLRSIYIGQILPESVVVSGPPSTLETFAREPDSVLAIKTSCVPLRCPMHGPYLPPVDSDEILGISPMLNTYTVQRSLDSLNSPPGSLPSRTLGELLRLAVTEIAHKPLRTEESVRVVAAALREADYSDIVLTSIGSTSGVSIVQKIFQEYIQSVSICEFPSCPKCFDYSIHSIPSDAIAVVGMSGRFPESDTLDEFWSILETGDTTHKEIPASRFDVDKFYDPSRSTHNALLARHGCFIKKPGDFDHCLFNISPREASQMDPVQRMLLMTTYEALEMAGYAPSTTLGHSKQASPRIATYFGQTTDDWKTINEQQGIDTHFLPGVNRGFAPGRLCHYFQWAGGFYSVDTGCSSSATAVCLARDALATGKCEAAVVGGGTLLNAPEWFAGLSQGGFLSPTGACKTYSEHADGYCRGEAVGVVVLKRLADAVQAKDNVLAVVAGAARNSNAGVGSITHPDERAQAALYRRVLRQAAVRPHDVEFVEMHGTGTQAGDRVEMRAVRNVFASPAEEARTQPLIVGAVKANIGHSEAAAGIVSLIKAILIFRHNTIPPQPGQPISLNPHLASLLDANIHLANGQTWPYNESAPRCIFVNNFDAAGGNVSLLIHDAPSFNLLPPPTPPPSPQLPFQSDGRANHIVAVSGRTTAAFAANKDRLHQYLTQHPDTQLADLAYTTTARRMHHIHREVYVMTSIVELLHHLKQPISSLSPQSQASMPASSVVFAFTGQGSQHVGMGSVLYHTSTTFRRLLDSYQRLCDAQGLACQFIDIIRALGDAALTDATATERDIQVAAVALEIALAYYWQSLGIRPTLLIGHSLGEYAALCIAGVLSVGDALALAYERATLIFTRCPPSESGMLAVALPTSKIRSYLQNLSATAGCEISCINSPISTVVGGPISAIEALEGYLKSSENVATTRLHVKHAFHTRQMDPVLNDLESSASRICFHPPTVRVASTLLGRIVQPGEDSVFDAHYMRRHTREPVAFLDAVRVCESEGLIQDQSFVVEVGPHPTCIGLMASSLQRSRPSTYPSLRRGRDDCESISQCLAAAHRMQLPIAWAEFYKDHLNQLRMISDLPTYAFDNKSFWHSYKSTATRNNKLDAQPSELASATSQLSFTCLHSIEKLYKEEGRLLARFTADLSDQQLAKAIGGHIVDGVAICPASIFIEMAYTAAAYLEKESRNIASASLFSYDLSDLSMQTPLVLHEDIDKPARVYVEGVLDQSINVVSVHFWSRAEGVASSPIEHGSCLVRLSQSDTSWAPAWRRMKPLVKARVRSLDASSSPREVHAMDRRLFYKIFSEIVDYSASYHAVEEVIIAADFHDAAATLQLTSTIELGTFTCSPFSIDALVHLAGFLLNADVRKHKSEIHIANSIGSLRIMGDLSSCEPCRAYATIREQDAKARTSLCDVYVTNSQDKLVAICIDICFKKLDRAFFTVLISPTRAPLPNQYTKTNSSSDWGHQKRTILSNSSSTLTPFNSSASPSSLSDTVDLSAELLDTVAARSGMTMEEMKRSTGITFADMGIDSQMSIAILSDFQKNTAVELPAAFFTNFPTPAAVEKELGGRQPLDDDNHKQTNKAEMGGSSRYGCSNTMSAGLWPSKQLFLLVTDALGLEASDLRPSTTFESIGMDSMMSIKVMSRFQHETQIELPAAFFTEHPTVATAREALDGPIKTTMQEEPQKIQSMEIETHAPVCSMANTTSVPTQQQKIDRAMSRAVLIQGQSRSRSAPLFVVTDGSGTAESYLHLCPLPQGRRIYALESPFLECPEAFNLSVEEIASIFLRTIRKIQPHGPYLIGGWSSGAIFAYEVAHRLTTQGESILALIVLDMRAPAMISTAVVSPEFLGKLGIFEGINRARGLTEDLSIKQKAHLLATCCALARYDAPAFSVEGRPRYAVVVWARLGLDDREDAPPAAMGLKNEKPLSEMMLPELEHYFTSWFYGRREDFGPNGWETLLGDHVVTHCVDGGSFIFPNA